LSIVAEFAAQLHENWSKTEDRPLRPLHFPQTQEKLSDIRVMIFDVYGTLFNYWKPEFGREETKNKSLLDAFASTIGFFGMEPYLLEMNPNSPSEKTLWDLYHGLIAIKRDLVRDKDIEQPEIRIEEVWLTILLMLKRHGYSFSKADLGPDDDLSRCIAYYYNFHVFRRGLYPGVAEALASLKQKNLTLGILSNAQFYTPIDLTLFLRHQSTGRIEDRGELFDEDLVFYSCDYRAAKPSHLLFRKLFDALYELQVLPSQTVFVGNDLASDIKPAKEIGLKTAFFTGDDQCAFVHGLEDSVVPDIAFSDWSELPRLVSFQGEPNSTKGGR
jgi:putative hydrolase of the HAD superfamily